MKPRLIAALTLTAFSLFVASPIHAAAGAGTTKKVLVFTKSAGFIHDAIKPEGKPGQGYAFRVLKVLGEKDDIDFVFSKDGTLFNPAYLAGFDAFLFYTSGDMTMRKSDPRGDDLEGMSAAGKAALLAAIAGGKGFVGVHSASDSFHSFGRNGHVPERFDADGDNADPYIKMLGGEFIRHGAQQDSRLIVADPKFPGMAGGFDAGLKLHEEWYSLKNFAANDHAILVQDTTGMTGAEYQRPPYPSTWARMDGKGRVFYTNMGYREDIWDLPAYRSLLTGALNWVLGRVDADVTPNLSKVAPGANVMPKYVAPEAAAPRAAKKS